MPADVVTEQLRAENDALRLRLEEAEATLDAIRKGEVDAVVVGDGEGHRVYTLEGVDLLYRVLIEAMQQGAATLSADGTILYGNRSFATLLNVPPEKVGGTAFETFVSPADLPTWRAMLGHARTNQERDEIRLRPQNAPPVPVHLSLNALPVGGVVALGLIVTDLTDQKRHEETARRLGEEEAARAAAETIAHEARRAERALRQSEEGFRRLADALPQIVWMARPDGYVDYYNERWFEFTGVVRGEGGDESWLPVLHPDDVKPGLETWYAAVRSGGVYQIEYRFRDPRSGGYRWHLGRAVPVRDEFDRIVRWFGTCTDIDDQKRAEEKLGFLADASVTLGSLVDPESTLTKVARLAVPYFADWCVVYLIGEGRQIRLITAHADPSQEILLREMWDRYPPEWDCPSSVVRVLETGHSELVPDVTDALLRAAARDDGHLRLLRELDPRSFVIVPLTVRGDTVGVLGFAFSKSGRRHGPADLDLAEDLASRAAVAVDNARLYHEAKEADRLKDEFLAMLAHELRNPLAPIRNALNLVRMRGDERRNGVKQAHEIIERQVEHMVRLVDDLLDVSRITRGKIKLQKVPVDVAGIVARAVEGSRPLIDSRKHRLEVSVPAEPLRVEGDPTRLAQVLWNLLNNSAKYSPENSRIWLTVEAADGRVAVRVKDSGMGIPPEVLPRIFDLFTQAERTLDRAEGGLGIGLTLVRRLTELHGGTVEAHSGGPGQGSEFVVRLPLLSDRPTPPAVESNTGEEGVAHRSVRRRILVVDDNRDSADSLTMLLQLIGNEVRTAHDGQQALATVAANEPDLVLLDIGLPLLNGYEVAQRIRADRKYDRVVLVALTGYGSEEDVRRSQVSGFDHHMVKPVDFAALQALLDSLPAPEK